MAALVSLNETAFSADIIPANRLPPWKGNVGVPGGIPNRTTIYTTIAAGASASTIQNAINSCPSGQVVLLSPGTYTLSSSLSLKAGVTLRGSGMDVTILNASINSPIQATASFSDDFGAPVKANHVSWTGNYSQGTNVLLLSSVNLAGGAEAVPAGNLVMIDQASDANCSASGGYGLQGVWWSLANPTTGADRYQHQISYVTAKNGHSITIDPPIVMANYNSAASPQVWFEASSGPITYAGVENLTLHNTGGNNSARGINFSYTYACWILNCKVTNFRYDISTYFCVRNEFRHCYIGGLSGSGDDYDFSLFYQGGCLFEDNIVNSFNSAFLLESCIGDAYAYNYCTNANSTSGGNMNSGCFNSHGGNNAMNLLEGNYFTQVSLDNGWGSAFGFVLLRNRITGWDNPNATYYNYVAAIDDYSMNRYMSFVGNVLGTSGKNVTYEAQSTGGDRVYVTQLSIGGVSPSPDPVVSSSMVRAMNWDSANKGVVTGGYTASDVPVSLLYDSKPAYFGNLAWPPVDPTNPTYSSSHTNVPAGYRFNFNVDPPTGPVNLPPLAVAAGTPLSGKAPLTVAFSSSGSSDPEGASLTYSWNFGDGTSSTSANPSHTYGTEGTYTARLTVSDGVNNSTATALAVTVNPAFTNLPPAAAESANPAGGDAPLSVSFSSAGSSDPEGASLSYNWNFGDGSTTSQANPNHTYVLPGDYAVQLTVSDGTNSATASNVVIHATGLVAAFGFEETNGTAVLNDVTGTNGGTIANATRVAGKFGTALSFNGSNSVASITDSMATAVSSAMTIEAWVMPSAVGNSWRPILGKADSNSQLSYVIQGITPQNGLPSLYLAPGPNVMGSSALPANTWSYLAATYDGTNASLYVNGSLVQSQAQSVSVTPSSNPITIGSDGLLQAFWSGAIDEVRIYNKALSVADIQNDMNTPIVAQKPSPPLDLRVISP